MSERPSPINVLVPDGEHFYLQKVLRCIQATRGIRLYVISSRKYITMRFSRHVHAYYYFPKPEEDRLWIDKINEVCDSEDIDVIMPVFEDSIRILVSRRDSLVMPDKLLIPLSLESFDTANDKGLLAEHMEKYGIPAPKSYVLHSHDDIERLKDFIPFPVLAKPPLQSGGGKGIIKFERKEALLQARFDFPMVLQELIDGFDTGCNVLCRDGKILAYTIQKGFLYADKPYSPQIGLSTLHDDRVVQVAEPLMASLNYSGVANIDMIYDRKTSQYKVLEINPRFWNTVPASMMAGVNFPFLYCMAVIGREFPRPEYKDVRSYNLKGLLTAVRRDPRKVLDGHFLWKETTLKYAFLDPLPMAYHFLWSSKNILVRSFQKLWPSGKV